MTRVSQWSSNPLGMSFLCIPDTLETQLNVQAGSWARNIEKGLSGQRAAGPLDGSARALGACVPVLRGPLLSAAVRASPLMLRLLSLSLSDLQRPPFSLSGAVAPPQGPPFPAPRSLRPLRFCSTAQLPRTRLSLRGPPVPSGSLAACSLLLQVAFISLSLGVGTVSMETAMASRTSSSELQGRCGAVSPWTSRLEDQPPGSPLAWFLSWGCGHSCPRTCSSPAAPAVCPAGSQARPRGTVPQECGPRVRARVQPALCTGVQSLVCSTGQAPAGCSPRPCRPPVLATRPRQRAQQEVGLRWFLPDISHPSSHILSLITWPWQLADSTRGALTTQEKALGFSGSSSHSAPCRARSGG